MVLAHSIVLHLFPVYCDNVLVSSSASFEISLTSRAAAHERGMPRVSLVFSTFWTILSSCFMPHVQTY